MEILTGVNTQIDSKTGQPLFGNPNIRVTLANDAKPKHHLSRREFLKITGLSFLSSVLAACAPNTVNRLQDAAENTDLIGNGKNESVVATAMATKSEGWDKLISEGFPGLAVDSAFRLGISIPGGNEKPEGAGTMAHLVSDQGNGYWLAILSGHQIQALDELIKEHPGTAVTFNRPDGMQPPGKVFFQDNSFGYSFINNKETGEDLGFIVIPDSTGNATLTTIFDPDKVVQAGDINFGIPSPSDTDFNAVTFPEAAGFIPSIVENGINPISMGSGRVDYRIDNAEIINRDSGSGLYWYNGSRHLYAGPITGNFGGVEYLDDLSYYPNNLQTFRNLLQSAIAKINVNP